MSIKIVKKPPRHKQIVIEQEKKEIPVPVAEPPKKKSKRKNKKFKITLPMSNSIYVTGKEYKPGGRRPKT